MLNKQTLKYGIYLIRTFTKDHYYVGWARNVRKRLTKHTSGVGSKFTKNHGVADVSTLCELNVMKEAEWREKYYVTLLAQENPHWVVSCGAPLENRGKVLRHFGYRVTFP